MLNTSHKLALLACSIAFISAWPGDALSDIRRATDSLPKRMKASAAYGIGTVRWGAIAYSSGGRAELFAYEVDYGRRNKIIICTELSLYPSQKVLFALSSAQKHPRCSSKWSYIATGGSPGVIYAGYEDVVRSESWFQVSPGFKENFGCANVEAISTVQKVSSAQAASLPHGIPSGGTYFNGDDLINCLSSQGIPLYKAR